MTEADCTRVLELWGLQNLADATRKNWPFWGHAKWGLEYGCEVAVMPDFANGRESRYVAATMKLAEKMADQDTLYIEWLKPRVGAARVNVRWGPLEDSPQGCDNSNLGSALLRALEAAAS